MTPYKNYIILGLIITVLVMVLLFTCRKKPVYNDAPVVSADSTQYWKGRYDQEVASQKARPNDFQVPQHLLDSIAKGYHTTIKDIQSLLILVQKGNSTLAAASPTQIVLVDSSRKDCPPVPLAMRNQFHNPYYDLDVQLGKSQFANLIHRDTLTSLWKKVRTGGIFNRTEYLQIDNSFADTSNHVAGMTNYRVPVYKNVWGIALEAKTLMMSATDIYGTGAAGLSKETPIYRATILAGRAQKIDGKGIWYGEARITTTIPLKRK